MLDQRIRRGILERSGRQLVGIVVAEIEPLGRGETRVVLRPSLDFAFGVVGVILLGDEVLVRVGVVVQVLDLLEPLVLLLGLAIQASF